jgi:hypothetical protein
VPSGIPIPIPRDLQIPNSVPRSGFKSSGFGIPNPFRILFKMAQIFFLWIKSHQAGIIIICKCFEQKMYKVNILTYTRKPEKTQMWCSNPKLTKMTKFLLFKININKKLKNVETIFNPEPEPIPKF